MKSLIHAKTHVQLFITSVLVSFALAGFQTKTVYAEVTDESSHEEIQNTSTANLLGDLSSQFSMYYFAILYGPSVGDPASYQPAPTGHLDRDRPVFLKNFLSLGYNVADHLNLSGNAYWTWQPVLGQEMIMRDPFARISYDQIIHTDKLNLYGDFRVHFPITSISRENDMLSSLQTFQILTYQLGNSRFTAGAYASERVFIFGGQGFGNDLELYLGPNLAYQINPTLSATLLYEMGGSHRFGEKAFQMNNDGTDLEPGVSWDVTPNLNINPYLNIYTGGRVTLSSTAVGMTLSWKMI